MYYIQQSVLIILDTHIDTCLLGKPARVLFPGHFLFFSLPMETVIRDITGSRQGSLELYMFTC